MERVLEAKLNPMPPIDEIKQLLKQNTHPSLFAGTVRDHAEDDISGIIQMIREQVELGNRATVVSIVGERVVVLIGQINQEGNSCPDEP